MPPTLANGKICYIEMPALDIARSAEFYRRVFGWKIRKRGDGSTAFDDTTGEVSGTWVLGRPAHRKARLSVLHHGRQRGRGPLMRSSAMEERLSSRLARTRQKSQRGSTIQQET
jgi:catechol 2,3-dioxygenase-like lactoylglutathione lyase family enzyme